MDPIEAIRNARPEALELMPPLSAPEIASLETELGHPLPDDLRVLLAHTAAIDGAPLELDFTGRTMDYEGRDLFPAGVPIAHDGAGNFWVVDANPDDQEVKMSKVASKLNLAQVGRVCVTVADTDRAIDFYVDTLGFEKVVDVPMGPELRWVEVALPGTATTIALAPPPEGQQAGGSQTGICLDTSNVDADHAALKSAGVDVDEEVTRWGDPVPPMFWLRDPDGNSLIIVQPTA